MEYKQELLEIKQTDKSKISFIAYQKKRLAERYAENEISTQHAESINVDKIIDFLCLQCNVNLY